MRHVCVPHVRKDVMAGPVDLDVLPDPPVRLFTRDKADALVPVLEAILLRMDPTLTRIRELRDLMEDQEAYWGSAVQQPINPDRDTYGQLLADLTSARASLEEDTDAIRDLGGQLKDADQGLVDFYARIDGQLAYLCWRRGEPRVAHWHTLEAGFAGRRALSDGPGA